MFKAVIPALATLLTTSLLVSAAPASSDEPRAAAAGSAAASQLPDSRTLAAPTVARGRVAGTGLPQETRVVAMAWPAVETLETMAVGTEFNLLPIAATTTSANGSYALRVDPTNVPATYRSSKDEIDVTVVASAPGLAGSWTQTVAVHDGAFVNAEDRSRSGTLPAPAAAVVEMAHTKDAPERAGVGIAKPWTECTTTLLERDRYRQSKLAEGLVAGNQKSQFIFRTDQSVTTGVAINIDTDSVGWKSGGEVTRSRTFEWTSLEHSADKHYSVENELGKYRETCYQNNGGSLSYLYTKDEWRSIRLTGGTAVTSTDINPNWTYCRDVAGGWWARSSGSYSAYYNGGGFNISGIVGFDVMSRQQWDTDGKLKYWTPTNNGYQLCGNNDVPLEASRIRGKQL